MSEIQIAIEPVLWSEALPQFLHIHGERRVTPEAMAFYSDPTNRLNFDAVRALFNGHSIGYSASALLDGTTPFSVTVVLPEWRNRGIGTLMLRAKIDAVTLRGFHYAAMVAEDNLASRRMCEKTILEATDRETRQRKAGPYTALHFTDPR